MQNISPEQTQNLLTKNRKKIATSVIVLGVIAGSVYYYRVRSTTVPTRYTFTKVTKGTIVQSVSGTGQVSADSTVDLKANASAKLTRLNVVSGQRVKSGQIVAQLDSKDVAKSVRDAKSSLESSKLDLQKLQEPPDTVEVLQLKNSITAAQEKKTSAQKDVDRAKQSLLNSNFAAVPTVSYLVSNPPTVSGTYKGTAEGTIKVRVQNTGSSFFVSYSGLINDTRDIYKGVDTPLGDSGLYINFPTNYNAPDIEWQIDIPNTKASNYLNNLNSYNNSLDSYHSTVAEQDRAIAEAQAKIDSLNQGANTLDIKSKQLDIEQRQNALLDAQSKYEDYVVRAPFDGVITNVPVVQYQTLSSGTVVASISTPQKIIQVPLNEVDVAKVKVGQKVNMSFDALSGLSLTGKVVDVSPTGTVSQGVVSYTVKIGLDADNENVKSSMSASVTIVTEAKTDVLKASSSAIKQSNAGSYVEYFEVQPPEPTDGKQGSISAAPPKQKNIQTGLVSDSETEITGGLTEGESIVLKSISPSKTSTTQAPSLIGGGGGGARALGR